MNLVYYIVPTQKSQTRLDAKMEHKSYNEYYHDNLRAYINTLNSSAMLHHGMIEFGAFELTEATL